MARVRSLNQAGILAGIIHGLSRLVLRRALNPIKIQAHAPRSLLASFLANMIFGSGHRLDDATRRNPRATRTEAAIKQ